MNTDSAVLPPQMRERSRPFRSLLVATAASLVLTGFIVPRADATVISYFNFEESTVVDHPPSSVVDLTPDFRFSDPSDGNTNLGGGMEPLTSNLTIGNN